MQALLIAIQFLTRIPVARNLEWRESSVASSVLYYPLVGLLMGVVIYLVSQLLAMLDVPVILASAILLLLWVLLSGGLHLDGLADSADAWAGGYGDKEKTLKIMKDPAAGPLALIVLLLLLLVKFAALSVLLEHEQMISFLVVPVTGRMVVLLLFLTTPYVREQGLGSSMAKHLNSRATIAVLLISVAAMLILFSFKLVLLSLFVSALLLYALRGLMMQRIQGMTGDTIGASIELIEMISLVSIAILLSASV